MNDEKDMRDTVNTEASDLFLKANKLEDGSEEQKRIYDSAKALLDSSAKWNDYELKDRELTIRQKQLDQELVIHKDNKRNNLVRNVIEAVKVGVGAGAVWAGYKINFKENGIEFGNVFKDLRRNFTNIFR